MINLPSLEKIIHEYIDRLAAVLTRAVYDSSGAADNYTYADLREIDDTLPREIVEYIGLYHAEELQQEFRDSVVAAQFVGGAESITVRYSAALSSFIVEFEGRPLSEAQQLRLAVKHLQQAEKRLTALFFEVGKLRDDVTHVLMRVGRYTPKKKRSKE